MSIKDGVYEISTKLHQDWIVTVYEGNSGEGTRIRVNKNPGYDVGLILIRPCLIFTYFNLKQRVRIEHTDGDRYTLMWERNNQYMGYDKDNIQVITPFVSMHNPLMGLEQNKPFPFVTPRSMEWSVNSANDGSYK
jgi:hypothetical protein